MSAQNIRTIYFALLALLPLVYVSKSIVDPTLAPRALFLCLILWMLFISKFCGTKNLNISLFKAPILIATAFFLITSLFSAWVNGFNGENAFVLSKWLISTVLFVFTTLLLEKEIIHQKTLIYGICTFAVLALLGAYWDIVNILMGPYPLIKKLGEIKSFFGNKNLLSSALFLCAPFVLMATQENQKMRFFSIGLIAICLPILFLTQTRSVWLALLLFILTIAFFKLNGNKKINILIITSLCFVLTLVAKFVLPTFRQKFPTNFTEGFLFKLGNPKTLNARNTYWSNAWQMWLDHPLWGVGPGNFGTYYPKYGIEKANYQMANGTETLQRVHNDFLSVLCENGLLSFIAFIALWLIAIIMIFKLIRNTKDLNQKNNYIYSLSGLIGFAVICFLDFPLERIEHQILFFILLAYIAAESLKAQKKEPVSSRNKLFIPLITGLLIFASTASFWRLNGEINTVKVYQAKAQENWADVIYYAQKARNKFYQIDATGIPIEWYQGMAHFGRGEISESATCFETAYATAPYQIQVIHNLGVVYEQKNELDKAIKYYREALRISPEFEEALLSLAGCYYKKGMYHEAFKVIDKVNIESRNKRYRNYLVKILIQEMNERLTEINNPKLSLYLAQKITTRKDVMRFYWESKKQHLNFTDYIKSQLP
ncbi:MAG: O-antigen ligase family protein [Flavobacteriaceae bacterium]